MKEGLKCVDKAIKYEPRAYQPYGLKGCFLMDEHKYEKAIEYFNKALQINPNDLNSQRFREEALFHLQRVKGGGSSSTQKGIPQIRKLEQIRSQIRLRDDGSSTLKFENEKGEKERLEISPEDEKIYTEAKVHGDINIGIYGFT